MASPFTSHLLHVSGMCVSDIHKKGQKGTENYFNIAQGQVFSPAKNAKDFYVLSLACHNGSAEGNWNQGQHSTGSVPAEPKG